MTTNDSEPLLHIQDLTVDFDIGKSSKHRALNRASLVVSEGDAVGLVGESGAGKTVLSHSVLRLLPENASIREGKIIWQSTDLQSIGAEKMRSIRGGEIAMIFQDPQASLNPVYTVGSQIEWVLGLHRGLEGKEARGEALHLLEAVHLKDPLRCHRSHAHELSGGMCQRVMIAMALGCRPKLLIADEPTSALDITTQVGILELLREVQKRFSMSLLFISHDIRAVSTLCTEVAIMKSGSIVEAGPTSVVFEKPSHPYTRLLLESARLSRLGAEAA